MRQGEGGQVDKEISTHRQERQNKVGEERAQNQKKKRSRGRKWRNCQSRKMASEERARGKDRDDESRKAEREEKRIEEK